MHILIADDEKPLLQFLVRGLQAEGYKCTAVDQLHDVLPTIRQQAPQVAVMDRLFGNEDSVSIVESIKSLPNSPMVLMLTALDDVSERVKGLQNGADDYLCKPFDFDELLARVKALGRRAESAMASRSDLANFGLLEVSREERIAHLDGKELALTKIEFDLLLYLLENQQKVLSRERILNRVWQTQSDPQTNIVDVYISRLRRKLYGDPMITIQTLRGNGYRLDCANG